MKILALKDNEIEVKFDYNPLIISQIKTIAGKRWDSIERAWYVPIKEKNISFLSKIGFETSELERQIDIRKDETVKTFKRMSLIFKEKYPFLYDFQVEGCAKAYINGNLLIADEMGLGKAQPLDSKILTPNGWKLMKDIEVGDNVINSKGKESKVIGEFPQGKKKIYEVIFSDNSKTECCKEHLWNIRTPADKCRGMGFKVKKLKDLKDNLYLTNKDKSRRNKRYFIPIIKPIEFAEKNVPLDPYLLGVLIGDGCIINSVMLSTADNEILENIKPLLPEGMKIKETGWAYDYRIIKRKGEKNPIREELKKFKLAGCKSKDKFIPHIYKFNSIENRIKMLQGLLDTDGYVSDVHSIVQFTSASKRLIEDVKFLVQSLGGTARMYDKMFKLADKRFMSYNITIKLPKEIEPFRLKRKKDRYFTQKIEPIRGIKEVNYIGEKESKCISVNSEDNLYVTDDCILTHNTLESMAVAHYRLGNREITRIIVCCPASIKWQWKKEIEKWFNLYPVIIEGTPKQRGKLYSKLPLVMIINYEQFLRDFDILSKLIHGEMLILDEASYVKNPKAKRTKMIKELSPKYCLALTGTPVENRLEDVFTIGNIVHPFWMSKSEFYKYCIFEQQFEFNMLVGYKDVDEFMQRLMQIAIRRKQTDVKEMPGKIYYERFVKLGVHQKKLEDKIIKELQKVNAELSQFVLLQMVEDSTDLIISSPAFTIRGIDKSTITSESMKLKELMTALDEISDEKIVIFTRFKKMMKLIGEKLNEINGTAVYGSGDSDKEAVIKIFRDTPVRFLIATDAFAYGIDMPFATTVINFDIPWNPAKLKQRIDRIYRITSKKRIKVINLISEGLEDTIYHVMKSKAKLAEDVTAFNLKEQLMKFIMR